MCVAVRPHYVHMGVHAHEMRIRAHTDAHPHPRLHPHPPTHPQTDTHPHTNPYTQQDATSPAQRSLRLGASLLSAARARLSSPTARALSSVRPASPPTHTHAHAPTHPRTHTPTHTQPYTQQDAASPAPRSLRLGARLLSAARARLSSPTAHRAPSSVRPASPPRQGVPRK